MSSVQRSNAWTGNPVLRKEWRQRARAKRTPLLVTLYLGALGILMFMIMFLVSGGDMYYSGQQSLELFIILSALQFAMICFVTPGLTAGVISGERERQTLDILLTTSTSSLKIIVGKWFSSLSFILLLVVASIPLYSIIFLYGGISPLQWAQVFLYYIINMLALGAFGVLCSTLIRRTGAATVTAYGSFFLYTLLTAIGASVVNQLSRMTTTAEASNVWLADFLFSINPIMGMVHIFEGNVFRGSEHPLGIPSYWVYILFFSILTVIFLAIAVRFLRPIISRNYPTSAVSSAENGKDGRNDEGTT